ncbi:MAG TPA: YbhB/YbcL family Raf kinase inhibitor-like protein [Caulobacteraceae bacterium]
MKIHISCAAVAAALSLSTTASLAQPPAVGAEPGAALLARATLTAKTNLKLTVTSPAFKTGGDIPFENTSYRGNIFPGLAWTKGPYGTRTYAVIMQDDDALPRGAPVLHWTMYDIPASVTKLDAGMTAPPAGASKGPNMMGPNHGYLGPLTPPGPRRHYHFQVFALDKTIAPAPVPSYAALTGAMQGHVLASGELVGLARVDPNAAPRAPAKPPAAPPPAVPTDPGRISAPPP